MNADILLKHFERIRSAQALPPGSVPETRHALEEILQVHPDFFHPLA